MDRPLLSFSLLVAWLGALSAAGAEVLACGKCETVGDLVGNFPLGAVGAVFYFLLLIYSLFRPRARLIWWSLLFALAIHGLLLGLMLWARLVCIPCLITAAACAAATLFAWRLRRFPQ